MEHLSRSIDMGHHENLVQRVKIFGQRFGQFGLPVRHNIMVSKSMYTSPQNQQASVNWSGFMDVSAGFVESFTPSQIDDSYRDRLTVYFEYCMRSWAVFVGSSVSLTPIPEILL